MKLQITNGCGIYLNVEFTPEEMQHIKTFWTKHIPKCQVKHCNKYNIDYYTDSIDDVWLRIISKKISSSLKMLVDEEGKPEEVVFTNIPGVILNYWTTSSIKMFNLSFFRTATPKFKIRMAVQNDKLTIQLGLTSLYNLSVFCKKTMEYIIKNS